MDTAVDLEKAGVSAEVVDLRVLNPLNVDTIVASARKTGHLCVVDGGWRNCGLGGEIIASVCERIELKKRPIRITIAEAPAPTSKVLEAIYYPKKSDIAADVIRMLAPERNRNAEKSL